LIGRFALHRPGSVEEASALLVEHEMDAALYCGGTELLLVMKMGLASFGHLVDVKRIPELRGIERTDEGALRIGAAVTHREIERSAAVAETYPGLARLERHVANVRVRNTGSIGGNLCFAEPHSDPATFLLACGARLELASGAGRREVAIDEFVVGPLMTSREPDELLVAVRLPPVPERTAYVYRKFAFFERPAASVAVGVTLSDGQIAGSTIAVGSVSQVPSLMERAATALRGAQLTDASEALEAAAAATAEDVDAFDDINGSADYKRHLASVLVRRAGAAAVEEATRA
jgi:carbon-monoxide dehydrogenase medium subunit